MNRRRRVSWGVQCAERGGVRGEGVFLPARGGDLKMKHFGAVFKLDLTEETRTQLQEEEAIVFSCLTLAMITICLLDS